MKRIICWIAGHKWKVLGILRSKQIALMHLHPMAGVDADCTRCGYEWRDSGHDINDPKDVISVERSP